MSFLGRRVGIAAFVIAFCLYAPTIGHEYCLDDHGTITDNDLVHGGLGAVGRLFATEYRFGSSAAHGPDALYRPLSPAIFALEWQLAPDRPWVYHLVNVLLYAATAWALWATWRRILHRFSPWIPALATLFFVAHPVHTEVVANLKSLDEILALGFGTGALYALSRFAQQSRRRWLIAAGAALALALFSKESAIVFVLLGPLVLWFFHEMPPRRLAMASASLIVPAVLFLGVRWLVLRDLPDQKINGMTNVIVLAPDAPSRLASALAMGTRYLRALVFPHPLVSDMGYPQVEPATFGDVRALLGAAAFMGMGVWAVWHSKRRALLSFAILFFLISFAPASNLFVTIGTSYAERLLYVPSFGFALALAWVLTRVLPPASDAARPSPWLLGIASAIVSLYALLTVSRSPDWENDLTLFEADIRTSPRSALLLHDYGLQCLDGGRDRKTGIVRDRDLLRRGIDLLTRAFEAYPGSYESVTYRGLARTWLGEHDLARADFVKALALHPESADALCGLGFLYASAYRDPIRGEEYYRRAVAANPRSANARLNLGATLATRGDYAGAVEQFLKGLEVAPDDARLNEYLARAYSQMGRPDLAAPLLEKRRTQTSGK
jgi:tetratricopeptide (TPR) repeat protein